MSKKENFEIGSRVVTGTGAGKKGIIRYIGETEVRDLRWCFPSSQHTTFYPHIISLLQVNGLELN
jgi:hypothetical protein